MHLAIVGATGAVGREMCSILEQRRLRVDRLTLLASGRSAGQCLTFRDEQRTVRELDDGSLLDVDIALFSAGSNISKSFARPAAQNGTIIIDNSSAFRMDPLVPLVIPEINPQDIHDHQGIIANPNCSTIILAMAVWPLHRANPVKRMVVSTYQAVSGAGAAAMRELETQTREVLEGREVKPEILPHPCAFNLFSHDSTLDETGYNLEERKMVREIHKIFHGPEIQISATCVRVPVLRAHSESVNLTFEHPLAEREAREILSQAPGLRVVDDRERNYFPMPVDAAGKDEVLVGRIRRDLSDPSGRSLALFVCGDQLRKGAALNAIQIAELITAGHTRFDRDDTS